jgi:hypothetical protein
MKNSGDQANIRKSYGDYTLTFDSDSQKKLQEKLRGVQYAIGGIVTVIVLIMLFFFFFLLSGYFRERRDVFRMISIFGLDTPRSYVLTLGEPLGIIAASMLLGGCMIFLGELLLNTFLKKILAEYELSQIPLATLSLVEILTV